METISSRPKAPPRALKNPGKPPKRERKDWVDAAKALLVTDGIEGVKVEPLAKLLRVTTGSFYHHFANRQELLDALLDHWETNNSIPMFAAVESAGENPDAQIDALFRVWVDENDYDPTYDAAVRAWAHTAKSAESAVRRVDDSRIELLRKIFLKFGYEEPRAFVRARITYFHQVGYQAMEILETKQRRDELLRYYREVLIGPASSA